MIAAALFSLGPPPSAAALGRESLLDRLPAAQGEEQLRVIAALGAAGDARAAPRLLALLDVRNGSPRQSTAIVKALGLLGDRGAVDALLAAWDYLDSVRLRLDELPAPLRELRGQILRSLGLLGDRRASLVVLGALQDGDPFIVARAVEAAGKLKEKKAIDFLLDLLAKGGNLAQAAYEALGEIADERAAAALERGMKSEDPLVQAQAAYAAAKAGKKAGEPILRDLMERGSKESREGVLAAYYMARLNKNAGIDYLLVVLKTKGGLLRAEAALALAKAGGRRAADALDQFKKDADPAVRAAALSARP